MSLRSKRHSAGSTFSKPSSRLHLRNCAAATSALTHTLEADKARFKSVTNVGTPGFSIAAGFSICPWMSRSAPRPVHRRRADHPPICSTDRSLRGLVAGTRGPLLGLQSNRLKLDDFAGPLNMVSDSLEKVLAGKPASFSWQQLTEGAATASLTERLGFIEINPALDLSSVEPGEEAEATVHRIAASIAAQFQASVRVTGPVAIDDEQFGSIKENAIRNGAITIAIVVFILWMALRSGRLILALVVNLLVGLTATAAAGLLMLRAFNIISIYFAVLFVGIGVDFAIQFSVRYRDERHRLRDLETAIRSAGSRVAMPLALASLATAAGFSLLSSDRLQGRIRTWPYRRRRNADRLFDQHDAPSCADHADKSAGEPEALGYAFLAPVDEYLARHRMPIIVGTLLVVACVSPALSYLKFDFNPINCQNQNGEGSVLVFSSSRRIARSAPTPCRRSPPRSRRRTPSRPGS